MERAIHQHQHEMTRGNPVHYKGTYTPLPIRKGRGVPREVLLAIEKYFCIPCVRMERAIQSRSLDSGNSFRSKTHSTILPFQATEASMHDGEKYLCVCQLKKCRQLKIGPLTA